MKNLSAFAYSFLMTTLIISFSSTGQAQQRKSPFVMVESHKRGIQKDTLAKLEAAQAKAKVTNSGKALVFPDSVVQLIVRTGPESDMLSYRIQGRRNPMLILHAGTSVHILFVNVDDDMTHDLRFGAVKPPDTTGTVGSARLPHSEDDNYSAEEITIRATEPGKFPYFCSYKNHAANGMRGMLEVVEPQKSLEDMMKMSTTPMTMRHGDARMSGEGTGTVRSIDPMHQTITLDHGNIPGIMMAMTMAYKVADAKFLQSVKVNASVRFTLTRSAGGEFLITEIQQQ